MLPSIRQDEYHCDIPKMNLPQDDIEDFIHELKGFHKHFEGCFTEENFESIFSSIW